LSDEREVTELTELPTATPADDGPIDDESTPRRGRLAPFVALAVALVVAGLFVVLAGSDPSTNETADTHLLGRPAPDARGELSNGGTLDLARRKGSWVVLNFFTSDCVPCIQEHPDLVEFTEQQAALGVQGAELYTIVYDDDRARVEDFFAENGGDWPVVYDPDGSIAVGFGISKVPETWIIDPYGVVQGRIISRVTAEFLGQQLQLLREQM
jgi:cytochrome c biogenesis protein CcmG/thiol:disulfide interchange protein DsbE